MDMFLPCPLPLLSFLLSDNHLPGTVQGAGKTRGQSQRPGPALLTLPVQCGERHGSCEESCKEEVHGGLRGEVTGPKV